MTGKEKNNSDKDGEVAPTVNLAERYAYSDHFKALFGNGMALVEETANYLDSEGREAAKGLPRHTAMLYGSESMRLTTRLMQLASWLLLQRAASNGEMERDQLVAERDKIKLDSLPKSTHGPGWEELPEPFVELIARSLMLQNRILVLDEEIYGAKHPGTQSAKVDPVGKQLDLLSTALGAKIKR